MPITFATAGEASSACLCQAMISPLAPPANTRRGPGDEAPSRVTYPQATAQTVVDICPTDCLTITPNGDEAELVTRLKAPRRNPDQPLLVSEPLVQTARVMVKDEDLCVHCGLCAERCPTDAWDMQKSWIEIPHAEDEARCQSAKALRSA